VVAHTGMAVPLITDDGEVAIVIVAGANALLDAAIVDAAAAAFSDADVLLLQGEVPIGASVRAAELARAAGARVVVNPAPVGADSNALVELADLVVVNREEATSLGLEPTDRVVLTLGAGGVLVGDTHVPAFAVDVVDPTGAGDAFCAALAVAVAEGNDLVTAARFGAAAGACAVRRLGAEPGLPTRDEVTAMLAGSSDDPRRNALPDP
jgi:ribokinase